MRYTLIFCSELNIYALTNAFGGHRTYTWEELVESMEGNPTLLAWCQMAKDNPGVSVDYEMLPR